MCLFPLLTGRALDWASVLWDADPQIRTSFTHFAGLVCEVYEYPVGSKDISLSTIQGHETSAGPRTHPPSYHHISPCMVQSNGGDPTSPHQRAPTSELTSS